MSIQSHDPIRSIHYTQIMKPTNINQIGVFQEADNGTVTSDLGTAFGGIVRGTNIYVSINHTTLGFVNTHNTALSKQSIITVNDLIESMKSAGVNHYYLNVGLEPKDGYDYALSTDGQKIVSQLASDLTDLQGQANDNGAQLDIYIRYASEMNLRSYPDNGSPYVEYSSSFGLIADIVKAINSTLQMAFSPAINFQTNDDTFHLFWPGADVVDVISCTWYINGATLGATPSAAITNMRNYFLHRVGANKKFGIDELGGWDPAHQSNDTYLGLMFNGISQLAGHVELEYVTVFLQNSTSAQWNHNPVTLGL